ncbi:MAG: N-formylglutamate amidohydrolase [Capsulimonas sp.]|uniref:N-formylglutamate amidohydrolase n=1 Tax=Capsulimonas sp. TaxID=2494211 RepID=UPI003263F843
MSIVVHIPHAGIQIPASERQAYTVSPGELDAEMLRMTDHYTDELFGVQHDLIASVVFPWSRLLVDPERFRKDTQEPMAARGMGAIYTRTSFGEPLRDEPSPDERERLLRAYYDPHHAAFEAAVGAALDRDDRCLIVDAHSFPSIALPCDMDQASDRPEICIGTDAFHTPAYLAEAAAGMFRDDFWITEVNRPYAGAIAPMRWYGRDRRVDSIMIEVNRATYMDETTGAKLPGFDDAKSALQTCLGQIIGYWSDHF